MFVEMVCLQSESVVGVGRGPVVVLYTGHVSEALVATPHPSAAASATSLSSTSLATSNLLDSCSQEKDNDEIIWERLGDASRRSAAAVGTKQSQLNTLFTNWSKKHKIPGKDYSGLLANSITKPTLKFGTIRLSNKDSLQKTKWESKFDKMHPSGGGQATSGVKEKVVVGKSIVSTGRAVESSDEPPISGSNDSQIDHELVESPKENDPQLIEAIEDRRGGTDESCVKHQLDTVDSLGGCDVMLTASMTAPLLLLATHLHTVPLGPVMYPSYPPPQMVQPPSVLVQSGQTVPYSISLPVFKTVTGEVASTTSSTATSSILPSVLLASPFTSTFPPRLPLKLEASGSSISVPFSNPLMSIPSSVFPSHNMNTYNQQFHGAHTSGVNLLRGGHAPNLSLYPRGVSSVTQTDIIGRSRLQSVSSSAVGGAVGQGGFISRSAVGEAFGQGGFISRSAVGGAFGQGGFISSSAVEGAVGQGGFISRSAVGGAVGQGGFISSSAVGGEVVHGGFVSSSAVGGAVGQGRFVLGVQLGAMEQRPPPASIIGLLGRMEQRPPITPVSFSLSGQIPTGLQVGQRQQRPAVDFSQRPPLTDFSQRPPAFNFSQRPPIVNLNQMRPPGVDFSQSNQRPPGIDLTQKPPGINFNQRPPGFNYDQRFPLVDIDQRLEGGAKNQRPVSVGLSPFCQEYRLPKVEINPMSQRPPGLNLGLLGQRPAGLTTDVNQLRMGLTLFRPPVVDIESSGLQLIEAVLNQSCDEQRKAAPPILLNDINQRSNRIERSASSSEASMEQRLLTMSMGLSDHTSLAPPPHSFSISLGPPPPPSPSSHQEPSMSSYSSLRQLQAPNQSSLGQRLVSGGFSTLGQSSLNTGHFMSARPAGLDDHNLRLLRPPFFDQESLISTKQGCLLRPPIMEQGGLLRPPTMGQGGVLSPPTMEQGGLLRPPTMGQGRLLRPPSMEQGGVLRPPTMGQGGLLRPPTMEQGGVLRPPTMGQGGLLRPMEQGGLFRPPSIAQGGLLRPPTMEQGRLFRPPTMELGRLFRPPTMEQGGLLRPPTIDQEGLPGNSRASFEIDQRVVDERRPIQEMSARMMSARGPRPDIRPYHRPDMKPYHRPDQHRLSMYSHETSAEDNDEGHWEDDEPKRGEESWGDEAPWSDKNRLHRDLHLNENNDKIPIFRQHETFDHMRGNNEPRNNLARERFPNPSRVPSLLDGISGIDSGQFMKREPSRFRMPNLNFKVHRPPR